MKMNNKVFAGKILATLLAAAGGGAAYGADAAEWITGSYVVPGEDDYAAHFADAPAPVLKRVFTLAEKPVKHAVWRIASPGMYDASVNGKRVNAVALPIWTAFDRRVLEDEYDVTALVKGGANTLTLELGNGWWNPLPMKMWGVYNLRKTLPHGTPTARATLEVEFADGTAERIVTDGAWQAAEGSVLRNNLYLGEKRDMRRTGDGAPCQPARIAKDAPKGNVLPRGEMPPVVVYDRWKAKSVKALPNGNWIVDMGVNFAGTIRATLKGMHDGDVVTFRYGELLHPDGTVNVMTGVCGQQKRSAANPPGLAEQKDTVICPESESFIYEPRFTFHGFRYVEVAGLRETPSQEDFEALAWSADVKDSASFECSDEKVNLLRETCRRTFRSNLQGVQSDCPARERFGYGGDLAATAESLILNYDMAAFYRKVVRDRCDMEALHGVFTSTSPAVFPEDGLKGLGKNYRFGWGVDAPIVVDLLLRYYGDTKTMREAYPALRRFLLHCEEAFDVNHVPPCIGDHEALEKADVVTTAQCHYHQFLKLTAKFARILGETADADRFEATAKELEAVFAAAARYVPAKGFVGNGRQGEECFAIYHKMLPPDDCDAAYGILRENVIGHEYALSTGIFSTQYLLEILLARGDAEIAGKVLAHKGFPGWFYMLDSGATTLWETWAPSDNIYSQNHPMFGSCAAWLMRGILGIQIADDAVGCDKVRIEPHAVAGITWANGHLDTPKGRISVSWRLENGQLKVEKQLPDGIMEVGAGCDAVCVSGKRDNVLDELMPIPAQVTVRGGSVPMEHLKDVKAVRSAVTEAPAATADEAYILDIAPEGVTITASGPRGERWARVTLDQLMRLSRNEKLPCCRIVDWPRLKWRGFMLDSVRNYLPVQGVKDIIDVMSRYKLNLFHWHLTENYAWRLESKRYPQLQSERAFLYRHRGKFYTQEEFREIVDYAYARGLCTMPEFDFPGHSLAFRRAFGFETMSDTRVAGVAAELFDELCTLAPKEKMPFVHMGTDEVWKRDVEAATREALEQMAATVAKHDRAVVSWVPGEEYVCAGRHVNMLWTDKVSPDTRPGPYFDAIGMYIEDFDPFELLSVATYHKAAWWHDAGEKNFGAIFCAWHDGFVGMPYENLLRNQPIFPSCVLFGNNYWRGLVTDIPKFRKYLPRGGDPLLVEASEIERRTIAQRDRALRDLKHPFHFLKQTDMRWRLTQADGTLIITDIAQATISPGRFTDLADGSLSPSNGTVIAETWIKSPKDQTVGAWIGFTNISRDHGMVYTAPLPDVGEWNRFGASVELNGEKIAPPKWKRPGVKKGKPLADWTPAWTLYEADEEPFTDQEYFMREPTPIKLRKGWNHVKLTLPNPLVEGRRLQEQGKIRHRWVGTFIPVSGATDHPCEVAGLEYASNPPCQTKQ